MIAGAIAFLSGGWASALALGWLVPAAAGAVSFLATKFLGGDWWLAFVLAAGAAGFVFIWARFGLKAALAEAAAFAAYVLLYVGERRGAARQAAREKADADRRAVARERTIEEVRHLPDDELRRRARRWVRDDG
ncbi:hypothetical protein [Xanthobacter aminoxidans]|uniref:hypothetical protein n=1 Tax=Xanthobacter aminoxidans TaxID=186280 RepID=UPI002022D11D|nr:hypothetical protein [Xanthobacter aminoxidans]MCL8385665.1 hypothetical protein [Xanthobacter aminoxidans]